MKKEEIIRIVVLLGILAVVCLVVRYLWPLILIAVAIICVRVYQVRKLMKNAQQQAYQSLEDSTEDTSWQNDLFQAQANGKKKQPDVIDAEYTQSEEDSGKE